MEIKLRVKELAKAKGITISRLAELVGITQPNMSNIANGKTSPSIELLARIASALGVEVSELFVPSNGSEFICPHCGARLTVVVRE